MNTKKAVAKTVTRHPTVSALTLFVVLLILILQIVDLFRAV